MMVLSIGELLVPVHINMLREFDGRRLDLGVPEQFVLLLTDIPEYDVLLQGLMTKLEYTESIEKLKSSLDVMNSICKIVLENQDFQEFFHFVLNTGNFLNHGCLQGDAAGFKLASLERMMKVKSNIPNQTLLHHVIKLIHQSDDAFLSFLKDLLGLEKKSGSTLHDIKNEISRCNKDLCQFIQLLSASSVKMKVRFQPFIDDIKTELLGIQSLTMKLREMSHRMANYFCEDEKKFNLEDCLQSILQFCKLIRKCHTENITFCKQTQLATRKTDQLKTRFKNKLLSLEFGKDAGASSSILEDRNKVLDRILDDLHSGNFRPVFKSGAITPETETEALEVSHISFIGTADILSDEPCTEKQEFNPKEVPLHEQNYQGNNQEEMLDLSYIKPVNKTIDLIKSEAKRGKGHNRSRSDFTDSVLVTEPWMIQEVRQHDVLLEAPLAEPESMCALSTLNLENHGKFIDLEDVKHFEENQKLDVKTDVYVIPEGPILKLPLAQLPEVKNEPQTKCKPEKRMSFGKILRNKLSRVVLRPKNDGGTIGPVQDKKRFGLFGRRKVLVSSSDKENLPVDEIENLNIDKKQSAKEKMIKIDKLRETNI
ncbi:hypothetical protein KUTeg_004718 [Tegillarca granosa]|uniref:FH2 domain-containing protein n=1 Tax=Tegillarca granosa TaxID=220873 RepID=A0ABQ9FHR2_TEGGR|nr:hypothetical protein KUTeg_004718 [Tegillarca granosa]